MTPDIRGDTLKRERTAVLPVEFVEVIARRGDIKMGRVLIASLLVVLTLCPARAQDDRTPAPPEPPAAAEDSEKAPPSAAEDAPDGLTGKILLPSEGEWTWWALDVSGAVVQPPVSVEGDTIDWMLDKTAPAGTSLYVLNQETGNVAQKGAAEAAKDTAGLKLVESDFNIIHRLEVLVTSRKGDPVEVASVRLKDASGKTATRILDASDKGSVTFTDVPAGKAELTVGSGDVSVTQQVTLDTSRDDKIAKAEVVLAGDVPTIAPPEEKPDPDKQPAKPRTAPTVAGPIAVLVSLLLIAAIVYIVYLVLKSRKVTMKSMLERAGIPVEEDQPAPGPSAAEPAVPSLDPDLIGPVPGEAPAPTGAPAAAPVGPRLVGQAGTYSGTVFQLQGDSMTIGRDPGCDVALPDDSTASRRHARITRTDGAFTIYDEGSSNGTFVNGRQITEQALNAGDEVQVGSTRFRFEM